MYVIKDLGNGMCQGVCNDFYCTIPTCILVSGTDGSIQVMVL